MRRADGVDGGEGLCECLVFVRTRGQFRWYGGTVQGGKLCAGLSQLDGVECGEGFACEPGGLDALLCAVAGLQNQDSECPLEIALLWTPPQGRCPFFCPAWKLSACVRGTQTQQNSPQPP